MIQIQRLCEDFEGCVGWPYRSPGGTGRDCSRCGIDCSGMFVRAFRLQGADIAHGSNTIWRKYLAAKGRLTDEKQLERGMAVFKHKDADTAKYPDGEGDFCHIGLVTGVRPLRIVHASTEGMRVKADSAMGKWSHWGKLAGVAYGGDTSPEEGGAGTGTEPSTEGETPKEPGGRPESSLEATDATSDQGTALPQVTVTSPDGNPIKLRAKPTRQCGLYWLVPPGAWVTVLSEGNGWWKVRYGTRTGYMMAEYLERG